MCIYYMCIYCIYNRHIYIHTYAYTYIHEFTCLERQFKPFFPCNNFTVFLMLSATLTSH